MHHQTVALNALQIMIVQMIRHASIRNAVIHVPALVELMQNVVLLVIYQIANAYKDTLVIHLQDVSRLVKMLSSKLILVCPVHVEQMQFVESKTAQDLVPA